jgi:hypothetical protein
MTDERTLYETDRKGWLAYVAPNMARKLVPMSYDELREAWAGIPRDYQAAVVPHLADTTLQDAWTSMPRDDQTELWALLPEAQRQRIRTLRKGK